MIAPKDRGKSYACQVVETVMVTLGLAALFAIIVRLAPCR
jgi:hypothetical protein